MHRCASSHADKYLNNNKMALSLLLLDLCATQAFIMDIQTKANLYAPPPPPPSGGGIIQLSKYQASYMIKNLFNLHLA